MLDEAGKVVGITDVRVDQQLGAIIREYERMDDESFIAFGERLAAEVGGTFKISGTTAVLAKRNGGTAPSGAALPSVTARRGENLHSWDIAPFLGRHRYKETRSRYYDAKEAKWKEVKTQTEIEGTENTITSRFVFPDEKTARHPARVPLSSRGTSSRSRRGYASYSVPAQASTASIGSIASITTIRVVASLRAFP